MTENTYLCWFEDEGPSEGEEVLALSLTTAAELYARRYPHCFTVEGPDESIVVLAPDGKTTVVDVEMVVDFEGYPRR